MPARQNSQGGGTSVCPRRSCCCTAGIGPAAAAPVAAATTSYSAQNTTASKAQRESLSCHLIQLPCAGCRGPLTQCHMQYVALVARGANRLPGWPPLEYPNKVRSRNEEPPPLGSVECLQRSVSSQQQRKQLEQSGLSAKYIQGRFPKL